MSLRPYRIRYRDEDPGCPVFRCTVQAHNLDDAREKFHEGPDAEGWFIESITHSTGAGAIHWVLNERGDTK